MPRKKKPIVEVLPTSQVALVPKTANFQAALDRMVRDRVDQIMAERGTGELEPDYQTKELSSERRRSQNVFERNKWGLYFEKWGCKTCGRKKNVSHAANGHCSTCHIRIWQRLAALKREYDRNNPESRIAEDIDHLTRRLRSAQALLGERE
jgi:hypothetical protein